MVTQGPSVALGALAHIGGPSCHASPLAAAGGRGEEERGTRQSVQLEASFVHPSPDQGTRSCGTLGLLHPMVHPPPAQWLGISQLEAVSLMRLAVVPTDVRTHAVFCHLN